jgi:hypothetical protein
MPVVKVKMVDSVSILFILFFVTAWITFFPAISFGALIVGVWQYFLITKREKISFFGYIYRHPVFFLMEMIVLELFVAKISNNEALNFYIFWFYAIVSIGNYLLIKKREGVFSRGVVFGKILTIVISGYLWYMMVSQIYFAEPGNHFVGMFFIVFVFFVFVPYVIGIVMIDLKKYEKKYELLIMVSLLVIGLYVVRGFIHPTEGAFIIFAIPYSAYVLFFSNRKNIKLIARVVFLGYLISLPYFIMEGTDFGKKIKDPCFERVSGKGKGLFIKNGRVCGFVRNDHEWYAVTMNNLDVSSFREIGGGYFKDAKGVYYGVQLISTRSKAFISLGRKYYTDGEKVFFRGKSLDVDMASFRVNVEKTKDGDAYDRNGIYKYGKIVEKKY